MDSAFPQSQHPLRVKFDDLHAIDSPFNALLYIQDPPDPEGILYHAARSANDRARAETKHELSCQGRMTKQLRTMVTGVDPGRATHRIEFRIESIVALALTR